MLPPKEDIQQFAFHEFMCRDDFIEWILHSTNDDSEFDVYRTKHHIMVYVDRNPFKEG